MKGPNLIFRLDRHWAIPVRAKPRLDQILGADRRASD
jgi:hypothetical protein